MSQRLDVMYIGLLVVAGVALLAWRWQAARSWAVSVASLAS